jgi:hypothetical protein
MILYYVHDRWKKYKSVGFMLSLVHQVQVSFHTVLINVENKCSNFKERDFKKNRRDKFEEINYLTTPSAPI